MKKVLMALGAAGIAAAGLFAAVALGSGHGGPPPTTQTTGHTPVTICHKPGTPAQQTLVVDDDSVELTGHLGHHDTIGPCEETPPVDVCPNLEGNQSEVPEGFHLGEDENGRPACIEDEGTPTNPVDVCPNLEGDQANVPPGFHLVEDENGRAMCVEDTPPPTETTPTTPTHVVTGSAGVYCDLPSQTYIVTGEIDGNTADSVTPATIPGSTHGWTNVTVYRGDTDFRTAVFTYGDCIKPTPESGTTAAVAPATTTTATGPTAQAVTPKPKPDKPKVTITKTTDSTGKPIIVKKNAQTGEVEIKRPGGKYVQAQMGSG